MGDLPPPQSPNAAAPSTPSDPCQSPIALETEATADPVLCQHCGRTASNGISCQGFCVADSGY